MSNHPGFFIPRLNDKKVTDTFIGICDSYLRHIYCIQFTLATTDTILLSAADDFENINQNVIVKELLNENSFLISRINLQFKDFYIDFTRGEFLNIPSPLFDYISFTQHGNSHTPQFNNLVDTTVATKLSISKALQKSLGAISHSKLISTNLPREYEALLTQHNSMLAKLEDLSANLISTTQEKIQNLDIEYNQKRDSLDISYAKKEDELHEKFEREKQGLFESFSDKQAQLDARQAELESRAANLDNRDNTHVRRAIRDSMLNDVKARISDFGVSASTNRKRYPALYGMILLITVLSMLLGFSIWEGFIIHSENAKQLNIFNNVSENLPNLKDKTGVSPETWAKAAEAKLDNTSLYTIWFRTGILSIGLFGTILYYIRWQNRWADHHSNSEFHLQQFHIDVNRANWVIESCLEWRKETNSEIPSTLLESMTKNLFIGEHKNLENVAHPADELASALLGSASKLKMNIAGNELEIKNPGRIKSSS